MKRTRRYIPPPDVLLPLLNNLFTTFTATDEDGNDKFIDAKTLAPLFNDKCKAAFLKSLVHVKNGCLSDPPGIQLYYSLGNMHTTYSR
jgi:hypothetical protein